MELRRVGPKEAGNLRRRPSSPTMRPETPQAEASLQWVTARVPPDLVREIEAHAKRSGTIRHREGVPGGRVEEILGAIESVRLLLELVVGPPTLGTQRLLAHWASRDGAVKVSEDELMAEVRVVSADEWEQAVAQAERDLSMLRNAGPHDEKA